MVRRKELLQAAAALACWQNHVRVGPNLASAFVRHLQVEELLGSCRRHRRTAPTTTTGSLFTPRPPPSRSVVCLSEDGAADSLGDGENGDDVDNNSSSNGSGNTGIEGAGKASRKEGASFGEWDVEPEENNISEHEMSGLFSRISAFREREVEIDRVCAYNWRKGTCSHDLLFQAADPIQHLRWVGDHLAFGTDGGGTWIISRQTGFVINVFEGHSGAVTALYFDGELLVTGGSDKIVRVQRNSRDCLEKEQLGECLHVLEGHTERITGVARLDGSRLATSSADGSLRVWDVSSGETLHDVLLPSPACCLGAAEGYMVTGLADGRVLAWEAKRPERAPTEILTLDAHRGGVTTLSFPKQDVLLTGGGDGRVKYWDLNQGGAAEGNQFEIGGESYTHVFRGHAAPVTAVQCDEHRVVSAATDGTVSVWDIRSGQELFQIYGHADGVNSLQFDREQLVTDGTGETLYLHDFTGRRGAPAVMGSDSPFGDDDDDEDSQSGFRIGGGDGGPGPGRGGSGGGDGRKGGGAED
ncbi:unnamed protein product [Ectocarpus sp. 4 AP-2014]